MGVCVLCVKGAEAQSRVCPQQRQCCLCGSYVSVLQKTLSIKNREKKKLPQLVCSLTSLTGLKRTQSAFRPVCEVTLVLLITQPARSKDVTRSHCSMLSLIDYNRSSNTDIFHLGIRCFKAAFFSCSCTSAVWLLLPPFPGTFICRNSFPWVNATGLVINVSCSA